MPIPIQSLNQFPLIFLAIRQKSFDSLHFHGICIDLESKGYLVRAVLYNPQRVIIFK